MHTIVINQSDRRGGHGAAAVAAAEEVLRKWGCTTVRVQAPWDEVEPLLGEPGYRAISRVRFKEVDARPDLPPFVRVRNLTQGEFEVFTEAAMTRYAQSFIDRGLDRDKAEEIARSATNGLLPDGQATRGVALRCLVHERDVVGWLWVADSGPVPGQPGAYVYNVEVEEGYRGRGFGRALMLHAEQVAYDWGSQRIGLNVFEGNTAAEALYDSLGYQTVFRSIAGDLQRGR